MPRTDDVSQGYGGYSDIGGGRDGAGSLSRSPELGGRRPGQQNRAGAWANWNTREWDPMTLARYGPAIGLAGLFAPNPDGSYGNQDPASVAAGRARALDQRDGGGQGYGGGPWGGMLGRFGQQQAPQGMLGNSIYQGNPNIGQPPQFAQQRTGLPWGSNPQNINELYKLYGG